MCQEKGWCILMNVTGNRDQTDCLDRAAEAIVGLINRQPRSPSALDIRNLLQNFVLQRPTKSQQNTGHNERLEAASEGAGCLARAHKMNDVAHLATGLAHD